MPDTSEQPLQAQSLPLACTQFILQVSSDGATLVVGQSVISLAQGEKGESKASAGVAWHTQLFLPPVAIKKLAAALADAVAQYEKNVGPIPSSKDE